MGRKFRGAPWAKPSAEIEHSETLQSKRDPMARELAAPKYGQRVVPDKRRKVFDSRNDWRREIED